MRSVGLARGFALCLVVACAIGASGCLWWSSMRQTNTCFLPQQARAEWVVYPSAASLEARPYFELATLFKRSFTLDTPSPRAASPGNVRTPTPPGAPPGSPANPSWLRPATQFTPAKSPGPPCRSPGRRSALFAGMSAALGWLVGLWGSRGKTGKHGWLWSAVEWLRKRDHLPLAGLAAFWILLFANNLGGLPALVGYDVWHHLAYIRYVAEHHSLPLAGQGWEMFQPPLYYVLSAVPAGDVAPAGDGERQHGGAADPGSADRRGPLCGWLSRRSSAVRVMPRPPRCRGRAWPSLRSAPICGSRWAAHCWRQGIRNQRKIKS